MGKAAAESAATVIAEVNPRMPRTHGDSFLHVSRIDWLVENDTSLLESIPGAPAVVALEIARHALHKSGCELKTSLQEGVYNVEFRFGIVPESDAPGAAPVPRERRS